MTLWPPPDWILIYGIVAFVLAGIAVQSRRDLVVLIEIALPLMLPVKWLGIAKAFAVHAERLVTHLYAGSGAHYGGKASRTCATVIVSVILAALLMIAWRKMMGPRQEDAADTNTAAG